MEQGFDTTWDLDKYYSPHEPGHHWDLRRRFMEQNKDRYPEERLVCLAQTFANIEFMGCRYPKATMDLVEELAFGVVQEYRESQKNRLKRTFVSGSDAATSKVNKLGTYTKRQDLKPKLEADDPQVHLDPNDPLSSFIIVTLAWIEDEHPCGILNRSASFCKMPFGIEFFKAPNGNHVAKAKNDAANNALQILSRKCYSITVKTPYCSDGSVIQGEDLSKPADQDNEKVGPENVGYKLLKLMGWSGGGLGAGGAGMSEPVTAAEMRCKKEGLGSNLNVDREFRRKFTKLIKDYAESCNPYDLVFAQGFSSDQRKEMHKIARKFGLQSKSYGKDDERFITIRRKKCSNQILMDLISKGGSNEKYELIPPNSNRAPKSS